MAKILIDDNGKALLNSQGKAYAVNIDRAAGASPLTVTAAAGKVLRLYRTGKCTQASTPTPSEPVDIVCNNGRLVARYASGLPTAYRQIESMSMNNNCYWEIPNFPLYGTDTLKFSFSVMANCNVLGAYSGSADGDNYSLYVTTQSGNYLRYGSGAYRSALNTYTRYDATITPTGTSGLYFNATWSPLTFTTPTNFCIGSTSLTATSAKLKGTLYGAIEVVGRAKFIPCERRSDSVVGWYDIYSDTFYEPASGSTNPTKGNYVDEQVVVMVVGTDEVITLGQQTASVADLLQVGDYRDEQDIVTGIVTRQLGVKVLDGTETWRNTSSGGCFYMIITTMKKCSPRLDGISTHFVGTSAANTNMPDNAMAYAYSGDYGIVVVKCTACADVTAFKTFLEQQYAAGTPVIVVYPLATPTTEQATPQPLNTAAGQNTITANGNIDLTYKI